MTTNQQAGNRCQGNATAGDYVTYHDMANQTGEVYKVTGLRTSKWGTDYALTNARTGVPHFTDLRQYGWTFADKPTDTIELAEVTFEDGNKAEIPAELADKFLGLHNGHVIIDEGFAHIGLTACCNAGAKGSEGGTVCRSCYEYIDPELGGPMEPSFPFIAVR